MRVGQPKPAHLVCSPANPKSWIVPANARGMRRIKLAIRHEEQIRLVGQAEATVRESFRGVERILHFFIQQHLAPLPEGFRLCTQIHQHPLHPAAQNPHHLRFPKRRQRNGYPPQNTRVRGMRVADLAPLARNAGGLESFLVADAGHPTPVIFERAELDQLHGLKFGMRLDFIHGVERGWNSSE